MTMPTLPDLWSLLHTSAVELLGWTLLHFVWQGGLMAAALAGALYVLRDHAPDVRYAVSCAALVGLFALPIGTGVFLADSILVSDGGSMGLAVTAERAIDPGTIPRISAAEASPSSATLWERGAAWVQFALPWLVLGWAAGVLLLSVRLGGGAWRVRQLRRESAPAPSVWRERLDALAEQMGLRRAVELRVSSHASSPMVAGWWRPVILVPAGLLSGLPPDQVEALLLHELAHVRRHDVLVGRLQAAVEVLLFFHPATWWVSRQVRETREACCDDLTLQAGTQRTVYARALAKLAERALTGPQSAGVPAASDGSLLSRIHRLLGPADPPSKRARRLSMAVAVLLLVAVPLGVGACASQQGAAESEPEAAAAPRAEAAPQKERPAEPEAPEAGDPLVVTTRDDSARKTVVIRAGESVTLDSLGPEQYLLRYEHGDVDTIDISPPKAFYDLELFEEGSRRFSEDAIRDSQKRLRRLRLWSDSLEQPLRPQIAPDSLERVLRARFDPDSLERILRRRIDPDRLERHARRLEFRSDSLERVIMGRIDSDSLELALESRFDPDSLERELRVRIDPDSMRRIVKRRFNLDSLEHHVLRVQRRTDSLARVFEERFSEDLPHEFARHLPDSSFVVTPEAFNYSADLDRLRRHFEQMRDRWEQDRPEHLREQARRLRERAERLEKRAEEMEAPEGPEPPEAPDDTTKTSGASIQTFEIGEETSISIRSDQYEKWARQAAAQLEYDELLE